VSRIRTLRGQFNAGDNIRLILDDGRLTHGYKVKRFIVSGTNSTSADDVNAVLSLDYDAPVVWNWGDNRQIAWASSNQSLSASVDGPNFTLVDPDHVVIMDLWIQGVSGVSPGPGKINYFVELEMVELTDDQAILALIKERSQDDVR
jgi:hypothetical protein